MKKPVNFMILSALFSINAFAAPGFFPPTSQNAPAKVVKAAEAVYRYVYFLNEPKEIPSEEYDARISDKNPTFINRIIVQQLKACQAKNLPSCTLIIKGSGTAFVVGKNRDRLLTVRHNAQDDIMAYFAAVESGQLQNITIHVGPDKAALARHMLVSFVLLNAAGKPVFDTRFEGDWATPLHIGSIDALLDDRNDSTAEGRWKKIGSDVAYLKLSRPVGEYSLELRNKAPKEGEALYSIGYPSATLKRQLLENAPDSDGSSQYLTWGPVSNQKRAIQFNFGPEYIRDPQYHDNLLAQNPQITFSSAEAETGQSGSPILDADGKVAGLLVAHSYRNQADPFTVYLEHRSMFLNSDWILKQIADVDP